MRELLKLASRLAEGRTPVLIQGESGTGKDLLAHWLHHAGPRRDYPLIKVHCPSIPAELLESELFGHEAGAFTDAKQPKAGKIELAAGGTVFFDQVQDLTPNLQAKLLRVVEDCRFERLGGTKTIEVDVRFVAASSIDGRQAVSAGTFRQDLYHRLSVVPLTVPPLRERRDDILPLAETFLARERQRRTTPARAFARETSEALKGYAWPGNVRELRSVIERAALYTTSDVVKTVAEGDREGIHPLRAGPGRGPADPGRGHPRHQPQGAVGETATVRNPLMQRARTGRNRPAFSAAEGFRCRRAAIHSRRGA